MDIGDVQVFLAVVGEKSFSRAAWRLHRSQPVVSQTIRRLEAELGEPLFDRSSKGGRLTEAGKTFREFAERLVTLSDKALAVVGELRDLRRGRVVLGANEGAVPTLLPYISRFTSAHPRILVDVRRVRARDVAGELGQGNIDFGVTTFKPAEKGLKAITLAYDEMVALVRPDHQFAALTKLSVTAWAAEPIIVHSDPSPARESVFRRVERIHAPFNTRIALPTIEAMKEAVQAGLGITLLPRRCARSEIENGQLVAVPVPELRMAHSLRLVFRRNRSSSNAARAFLEIIAEHQKAAKDSLASDVVGANTKVRQAN
jgi:DNA-binding transcriptional LysR family regulator